ncbi:pyridoxal phosphate-dependent decarboxylase family protein [Burkholderia stagnalis]|uniref:pyridoxal phosphate-dependent decarboxylase family protein n=1 Tax=Burkholderia stagnalis TaxID=1503054 RepID=UPI0012DA8B2F|nr:pyridoxal-dependent decarboxylase [Burkholderia stagnalis]MDY7807235.1 pyridoxal-dependent decarboxylase [Burkholderia stagnalis]
MSQLNQASTNDHVEDEIVLSSWRHLWPHAKNHVRYRDMLGAILDDYYVWHSRWQSPGRAPTPERDSILQRTTALLKELSSRLMTDSVPWPACSYLAHMNTDTILPAGLAYFATMLYNPNNVTTEASPVTTALEHEVSDDFCGLVGFDQANGWAHLTSGGHAANYEAMWIARNLKSVPFSVADVPDLACLLGIREPNRLCNVPPSIVSRMLAEAATYGKDSAILAEARKRVRHPALENGRILIARNRHESWDKCANLLGLTLELIDIDKSMRLDVSHLRDRVFSHLQSDIPIVAVVATAGSCGEGSVDEIHRIATLRDECEQRLGVSFFLHVDAAFGGYHRSLLLPSTHGTETERDHCAPATSAVLKPEVAEALDALRLADTITVDPHKCAYVPYPAGCLAIRDRRYSSVVGRPPSKYFGQAPSKRIDFGAHTLEGARPGAAVAAVWMAHRVLGLHGDGLGALLARSIRSARCIHDALKAAPSFLVGGDVHEFRSVYDSDLNIINFCVLPEDRSKATAQHVTALSERIIGQPCLHLRNMENLPWFSKNRLTWRELEIPQANLDEEIAVVRCCVMKPISDQHFPEFWRNILDQLQKRLR